MNLEFLHNMQWPGAFVCIAFIIGAAYVLGKLVS
jgi:hypothetical protein